MIYKCPRCGLNKFYEKCPGCGFILVEHSFSFYEINHEHEKEVKRIKEEYEKEVKRIIGLIQEKIDKVKKLAEVQELQTGVDLFEALTRAIELDVYLD